MQGGRVLEGKTAIVTGASGGIGAATAIALAANGARVAIAARNLDRMKDVERRITASGGEAISIETDVTDRDSVTAMTRTVTEQLGGPHVLVNNAGLGLSGRVLDLKPEDLRYVFEVNVVGVLNCLQAVVPQMERGGRIVNISSVVGKRALPVVGGYCASKFALNALSDALRVEISSRGISVTSVYPGTTTTEFRTNARRTKSEKRGWRPQGVPPEKVAREVVRVVSTRKSPRDSYITLKDRALVVASTLLPGAVDLAMRRLVRS